MKNLIPSTGPRSTRWGRPAASAVAAALAIAAAAGILAAQGSAAPAARADAAPNSRGASPFKPPDLKHGVLKIEGTDGSDTITLRLQDGRPDIVQVDLVDQNTPTFSFERSAIERIDVKAKAGDDVVRIDESNGTFTDSIPTTIDGGPGNDTIAGGKGVERLLGGQGNDTIDGNGGNDLALLGPGDDTFVWDPGDGSDTVEGQDGADTMIFNGAGANERVGLSANGNRLDFSREPANITMDTAGVETVDFNALGGADVVDVGDLTGTDVTAVNVDLAGALGGVTGDGQIDRVTVDGTDGADTIGIGGDTTGVAVSGPSALVSIQHQDPTDLLDVNGLGGNDAISATALAAGSIALILEGGAGDDTLAGGQGVENLFGGDGNDTVDGNGGNDLAVLGAGDDTFVWDPGDGSDTVEGQDGADTMIFNGAGAAENVTLSRNGSRLTFFRNPGNVTMDTAGIETVDFNALGGADLVTVNDLTGTDVSAVNVDLAGTLGGVAGDGQADRVIVNSSNSADTLDVSGNASEVNVKGLVPFIGILHTEANDRLEINTLPGTAPVTSAGLAAGAIQLFVDGVLVP